MNTTELETVWAPRVLSILRIVAALIFMEHGTQKLLGFPPGDRPQPELFSLIGLAGVLELFGGILLVLGLFTRPVAFILSGEMAVAYWMAHAPQSFFPIVNGGDVGDPLLLRVPLPGGRRRRRLEPGQYPAGTPALHSVADLSPITPTADRSSRRRRRRHPPSVPPRRGWSSRSRIALRTSSGCWRSAPVSAFICRRSE